MVRKINNIPKGIKSVKGLSTKDILKMDVYKLNKTSLRQVTNRLISARNKRLRRLYNEAPSSPSLRPHIKGVNKLLEQFSLKGAKTRNDVESVLKDVKQFMEAKTSTIKGFKAFEKEVTDRLGEFEDDEEANEFWNLYKDWMKKHPNIASRYQDTNMLQSMLYEQYITQNKSAQASKLNLTKMVKKALQKENLKYEEESKRMENDLNNGNALRIKKEI